MAKRKSTKRYTARPYRAYRAPKKKRRTSKLNRSTVKPMRAAGAAAGAALVYAPYGIAAVKSRSIAPITGAITNKDLAIQAIKNVAVGYIAGTVAGKVVDTVGLKKPVNKIIREVKRLV